MAPGRDPKRATRRVDSQTTRIGRATMSVARLFVCAALLGLASCHSIGPTTLGRDHFDYNEAISASWKEQLLLNMVRLRYGDAPVFLDVASVIAQYNVVAQVGVNAPSADRPSSVSQGSATALYADKPTITFQPRTGQQLTKTLLTPIPLTSLFQLVQAGWPVELMLATTVRTLNGIPASENADRHDPNPAFRRAVAAIARVTELGASSVRRENDKTLYTLQSEDLNDETRAAIAELRAALDLDPATNDYQIVQSRLPTEKGQIAIGTAAVIEVLNLFSSQFEVPADHVARGWTYATVDHPSEDVGGRPIIVVHAGASLPDHVFCSTRERNSWFWIDEGDYRSKRAFSFLVMLLALVESGGVGPVVTIGAG